MKPILFRALLTLDPSAYPATGTSETIRTGVIRVPDERERQFHALVATADNEPFRPEEHSREVSISISDEAAPDYLATGVGFELWTSHRRIGHGVITRRAFV
ncbi:hypothetical protein [Nonomuraea sp. SYSU D8015]|uniref:hypothetical protein n=1 Tax=Nonomuraea sp. SYSU D8015 TaxID=2593644 RepID=UPI0016605801|nr:hypothetical protein [Nonomuraea sp. SYSU D8015]